MPAIAVAKGHGRGLSSGGSSNMILCCVSGIHAAAQRHLGFAVVWSGCLEYMLRNLAGPGQSAWGLHTHSISGEGPSNHKREGPQRYGGCIHTAAGTREGSRGYVCATAPDSIRAQSTSVMPTLQCSCIWPWLSPGNIHPCIHARQRKVLHKVLQLLAVCHVVSACLAYSRWGRVFKQMAHA